MPMVAWLAGTLCGLDGAHLLGIVMTVALPWAQNIFLNTTRYRVGEDVARETVLIRPSSACPWRCSSRCYSADAPRSHHAPARPPARLAR
jgi:hypothetical protein